MRRERRNSDPGRPWPLAAAAAGLAAGGAFACAAGNGQVDASDSADGRVVETPVNWSVTASFRGAPLAAPIDIERCVVEGTIDSYWSLDKPPSRIHILAGNADAAREAARCLEDQQAPTVGIEMTDLAAIVDDGSPTGSRSSEPDGPG